MSDHPIIFSAPMIRALLDGRKTMTRRVLKPQPKEWQAQVIDISKPMFVEEEGGWGQVHTSWHWRGGIYEPERENWLPLKGLRYSAGDRLWVRESMRRDRMTNFLTGERSTNADVAYYSADDSECLDSHGFNYAWTWARPNLPSIHMPRWASRLTLIVESVKVERLQDISNADAIAEGIRETETPEKDGMRHFGIDGPGGLPTARLAFFELWTAINGAESYRANPWVAAISFRVVKANIDAIVEIAA